MIRQETITAGEHGQRFEERTVHMWKVNRHGGRSTDEWKTVLETADEAKARARYEKLLIKLRQGGVELINPKGEQVRYNWAPRLRTRW